MVDIMNTAPADIKASIEQRKTDRQVAKATEVASKPTPLEKLAVTTATTAALTGAALTDTDPNAAMAQAHAVREAAQGAQLGDSVNAIKASLPGNSQIVDVAAGMAKAQEGQELKATKSDTTSFANQIGAAFTEMTAIPAMLRMLDRPDETIDPNFDYMAVRDKAEVGRTESDRQWLRESTSLPDLEQKMKELNDKDARYATIGAHGPALAVASSLTGGLLDPVGIAAGLGVGKVAQLAGVGVKLYQTQALTGLTLRESAVVTGAGISVAKQAPISLAQNIGEGVVGNVLYEATLDAAGQHVTFSDYVTSAGFGAVFGAGIHAVRSAGKVDQRLRDEGIPPSPREAGEDLQARAQEQNMDLYTQAQSRAGEGATPDEISQAADDIMREQSDQVTRIAHAEVPEQDRFFPDFDLSVREDGTVPQIDEVMRAPAERVAVSDRWGINMNTVEDGTERKMLGELAARAEGWAAANPIDAVRTDSILARVPWLASSGLTLARSENPVARMIAGVLLESTTGASGRRRTAAITKTMRERQYLENLVGYEEAYKQWRKQNGGSAYRDVLGSEHRSNFDRLVAADRENRRLGVRSDVPDSVRIAGDHLDNGYNRMRQDQQTVGTIGAQRLGDTSIGYVHLSLIHI